MSEQLCEHGCGLKATVFVKPSRKLPNGRWQCSKHHFACEAVKANLKERRYGVLPVLTEHLCDYGCGKPGRIYRKPTPQFPDGRWVCEASHWKCPAIIKKRSDTVFNRYGTRDYLTFLHQSENFDMAAAQALGRENTRLMYGVENVSQIPEIKAKVRQTCLERYGVPNVLALSTHNMVSNGGAKWLDELGVTIREKWLHVAGKAMCVDGYDPATNTVYEYYGSYWHGHPGIYDPNTAHPQLPGKTMGDLYRETIERHTELVSVGHKVIFVWEDEYISGVQESACWPHERGGE